MSKLTANLNKQANLQKYEELALKAKSQNADLIIFPEMSLTGYVVKDQIYELSEQISGPSIEKVESIAKKTGLHIIFGMPELSQKTKATIYNTATLISPKGYIGKYHKMYLPTQ